LSGEADCCKCSIRAALFPEASKLCSCYHPIVKLDDSTVRDDEVDGVVKFVDGSSGEEYVLHLAAVSVRHLVKYTRLWHTKYIQ